MNLVRRLVFHFFILLPSLGFADVLRPRLAENGQTDLGTATPQKLVGVGVREKLGTFVDKNLQFQDSTGKFTSIGTLLGAGKPVLLTLNYFTCASLCSIQLNALVTGLKQMDLVAGKDFTLATVSIDHRNDAALAASKREVYLKSLDVVGSDWNFLVGAKNNITKLADTVGFDYKYDPKTDQFAHNAAIFFISPDGKISRYLYGIQYSPRDIKFSLMEASLGKIGTVKDRLLLNCFHFDEITGKYTGIALQAMRTGGILAVVSIGLFLGFLWKRESQTKKHAFAPNSTQPHSLPSSFTGRI